MKYSYVRHAKFAGISTALVMVATLAAGPAAAEIVQFDIALDQAQEVPAPQPVDGASGVGAVIADTDANTISWAVAVDNLSGDVVGVHFHAAEPGQSGDVAVDIGGVSGLGTNLAGSAEITPEQMEQLLAGGWYVNFHTALNRPGEVRGQVVAK